MIRQVEADRKLLDQTLDVLADQRKGLESSRGRRARGVQGEAPF